MLQASKDGYGSAPFRWVGQACSGEVGVGGSATEAGLNSVTGERRLAANRRS